MGASLTISVIIPCYNYGRFLPDAVHSLIGGQTCRGQTPAQTLADFEAIIVDDASTDNSAKVAAELALADERVSYCRLFKNSGTAAALNAGIYAAQGQYVYILSADDLIEPWTLHRMLSACETYSHNVCYGDLHIIKGGKITKKWPLTNWSFEKVLKKNPMPAAGIMYPRECWEEVGGYPEVMRWGREGWAFNIACAISGWTGQHIGGDCGYLYRWDGQNRSVVTAGKHPITKPPICENWRQFYQCQIATLYPELYTRSEKDMPSCCGQPISPKPRGGNTPPPVAPTVPPLPGRDGFAVVQYVGPSELDQTYWIGITAYSFGARKIGYVAKDHLAAILSNRGKRREVLFVEVKPSPPPTPSAPRPLKPAQPVKKSEPEKATPAQAVDLDAIAPPAKTTAPEERPSATASAIELAEEHGVNIAHIRGTGADGRVTKTDVKNYLADLEERGKAPWVSESDSES